ncbi:MAG: prepilin peptidase [Oscillospiraceae bacterium]
MNLFLFLFFMLYGICIGSFLNVIAYRCPRGISVMKGRSMCPDCGHVLGFWDLIPVLSYLFLGRKCRYCKSPISSRYALGELLTGIAFGI